MHHQVLYIHPRGKRLETIYIEFHGDGSLKSKSTDVPSSYIGPWICVQRREYLRQLSILGLKKPVGRPLLSAEERQKRSRESGERYQKSLEQRRNAIGVPYQRIPLGTKAPQEEVDRVMFLHGQVNPATGRSYSNVEIALQVGRSTSFVSRVLQKQRRKSSE